MQDYTADTLVGLIKRRGAIPTSQQLFTPAYILDMANDEMKMNIIPLIMSVREEFFNAYSDTSIVADQTEYDIPWDAIGMSLDSVEIVKDSASYFLPRIEKEDIQANGQVVGFYLSGNKVVLNPTPKDASATLRLNYFRRPMKLTANVNGGQVTSIDTGTNTLTLSFVPASWAAGDVINSVNYRQPFNTTNTSMTVSSASSPTVTVDDVTGVNVGDWVSVYGDSIIPQIPEEAHVVLAQATVVKILEAMGDREGMKAAEAKLDQNKRDLLDLINPRVEGAPKKIVGGGILKASRGIDITEL